MDFDETAVASYGEATADGVQVLGPDVVERTIRVGALRAQLQLQQRP